MISRLWCFGLIADCQYADRPDDVFPEESIVKRYRRALYHAAVARTQWAADEVLFAINCGDIIDHSVAANDPAQRNAECLDDILSVLNGNDTLYDASHRGSTEGRSSTTVSGGRRAAFPVRHVVGNHCFAPGVGGRSALLSHLDIASSFSDVSESLPVAGDHSVGSTNELACYTFDAAGPSTNSNEPSLPSPNLRFIILDGSDISTFGWAEGHPKHVQASEWLEGHTPTNSATPNAYGWNAAIGKGQLAWLEEQLVLAQTEARRVIVVCHYPVLSKAAAPTHVLWNAVEVCEILAKFAPTPLLEKTGPGKSDDIARGTVIAFISGHYHKGGYAFDDITQTHHVTINGVLESPAETRAAATVFVHSDHLEIDGRDGNVVSRLLRFEPA